VFCRLARESCCSWCLTSPERSHEPPWRKEQLTSGYITFCLRQNGLLGQSGEVLRIVEAKTFGEGEGNMSVMQRLTLEYNEPGPSPLIVKLTPDITEPRLIGAVLRLFDAEVQAYNNKLSDHINMPHCYYADSRPDGRFIMVLEDLAPATTPDQVMGASADAARQMVDAIIPLHIAFLGRTRTDARVKDWLMKIDDPLFIRKLLKDECLKICGTLEHMLHEKGFHDDVEHISLLIAASKLMVDKYDEFVAIFDAMPHTKGGMAAAFSINHGDYRCENVFLDKNKSTIIDFQGLMEGPAEIDINYLISGSLSPTLRHDIEEELLLRYWKGMVAQGSEAGHPMETEYPLWQFLVNYQFWTCSTLLTMVVGLDVCKGNPSERTLELVKVSLVRFSHFLEDWNFIEAMNRHLSAPFALSKEQQCELLPAKYQELIARMDQRQ